MFITHFCTMSFAVFKRTKNAAVCWQPCVVQFCEERWFLPALVPRLLAVPCRSLWNELEEHEIWAPLRQYIIYEASSEFYAGGIRECSRVELQPGHLKHTIRSNLSTWEHCARSGSVLIFTACNLFFTANNGWILLVKKGLKYLAPILKVFTCFYALKQLFAM